jgi:hypothetical protein
VTDALGRLRERVSKRALRPWSPKVALRALSGVDIEEEPSRRVVWDVPTHLDSDLPEMLGNWRLRIAGAG